MNQPYVKAFYSFEKYLGLRLGLGHSILALFWVQRGSFHNLEHSSPPVIYLSENNDLGNYRKYASIKSYDDIIIYETIA